MAGQTLTTARPGGGAAALLRPVAEQLLGGELPGAAARLGRQ